MDELQSIFSEWSMEDLNMVLHLSNGDWEQAIERVLQHDQTGLPAEMLIRFLRDGGEHWQHAETRGQTSGATKGTKNGSGKLLSSSRDDFDVACPPSPYEKTTRHEDLDPWSGSHNGRSAEYDSAMPSFVQIEPEIGHNRERPYSSPIFSDPNSCGLSADAAATHLRFPPPEVILQCLSTQEKDQLLHQFLSFPIKFGTQTPDTLPRAKRPFKEESSVLSRQEQDMLNVQNGIIMSLNEGKSRSSSRGDESRMEDINGGALESGIWASEREFRELCRRRVHREELEKAMTEQVKRASLTCSNFISDQEDNLMIENVKRESLVSASPSLLQLLEAEGESLACLPPISQEARLIDEVKRESMARMQNFEGSENFHDTAHLLQRGNQDKFPFMATHPPTEDDPPIENAGICSLMDEAGDGSSPTMLDSKPAHDPKLVNGASAPRTPPSQLGEHSLVTSVVVQGSISNSISNSSIVSKGGGDNPKKANRTIGLPGKMKQLFALRRRKAKMEMAASSSSGGSGGNHEEEGNNKDNDNKM